MERSWLDSAGITFYYWYLTWVVLTLGLIANVGSNGER